MSEPLPDSFVRNCHIHVREGETLFYQLTAGAAFTLDGYAIIPMEVYEAMKGNAS